MNYGFIYCLGNHVMPGTYKIGMTDRAPSQRCQELSGSTSVPTPFQILCFGEVADPRKIERLMHDGFSAFRVSASREFFTANYCLIANHMEQYSEHFLETVAGSIQRNRDGAFVEYAYAQTEEERVAAVISAATKEGLVMWAEEGEVRVKGAFASAPWIPGAIAALKPLLLSVLPSSQPEVTAEELDW